MPRTSAISAMRFEARAYADGRITSLMIDAISQDDALQQLASHSVRLLSLREVGAPFSYLPGKSSPRFDLPLFSQELLALLEAGLSIIEAIDTLSERGIESSSHRVMARMAASLREGRSLSAAIETMPEFFPMLFIGIVRSSERTGDLQEALARYIDYRTRLDALRSRVISATIYPLLLLVVGALVTMFLGGYVIPRFAAVYKSTGRSLPWASALLLDWGVIRQQSYDRVADRCGSLCCGDDRWAARPRSARRFRDAARAYSASFRPAQDLRVVVALPHARHAAR